MSRSYRQEVLVVNHPSPSPDPPDRGYNNEAHMQGNLSLDSAPPSSAYSTSRRFDLSSTASASSEAPLFSDARCPLCSPQTSLLDETVLMQTGMLSFVQLNPCGHTYCTRCFETLLLASAMTNHMTPMLCTGQSLVEGKRCECRRQLQIPKTAITIDKVLVETRECRFETPSGNSLNVCELRLSLLDLRERVAPGNVVIRSSQGQPEPDARNGVWPVWVFMTMATHLERLWKLVRERRSDGQLFRRLSDTRPPTYGYNQQAAVQRALYQSAYGGPYPRGHHPNFVPEAGAYLQNDPQHTGADRSDGMRTEAATVISSPNIINPPRATSENTQPLNPNADVEHNLPDFLRASAPADVAIRAPSVSSNANPSTDASRNVGSQNEPRRQYTPDVAYTPATRQPQTSSQLMQRSNSAPASSVFAVDVESLMRDFNCTPRQPPRGRFLESGGGN